MREKEILCIIKHTRAGEEIQRRGRGEKERREKERGEREREEYVVSDNGKGNIHRGNILKLERER